MKVFLMTDLEGICGVDSITMIGEETQGYHLAQQRLMEETNAAVEGAVKAGADEILVFDGHGSGVNFIPGKLDPRATQVHSLSSEVLRGVQAFLCVGCHAMAGTENAFLDHTQSSVRWFEYRINGQCCGEIGQDAIWCGANNVPLVMVSGDQAACAEAAALIPGVACAVVKTARGRNNAVSIPQETASQLVEQAAFEGIRRAEKITPYQIELPAKVQLTLCRNDYCEEITQGHPEYERNGRILQKEVHSVHNFKDILF